MVVQTVSKTLIVNPAFLQEIKDSNTVLWHCLHEVRQLCHAEDKPHERAKRLVKRINSLREHLALQFSLEEAYGFIPCPSPNIDIELSEQTAAALEQHCPLYLEITDLCESAEELQYRGYAADHVHQLIVATVEFDRRLQRHERFDEELMNKASAFHRR